MEIQLPDFKNARVLVVGDVMLDRYWHGTTSRVSPEAPVPVVHIQKIEERPGGAGNVALNINALGGQATLLGFCGEDEAASILENQLNVAGVDCHLQRIAGMPTVIKQRVISLHQQLIRLDIEDRSYPCDNQQLLKHFQEMLPTIDCIILSDYAKGTLHCAPELIDLARRAGKPILIDPKSVDFNHYRHANLVTPNRKEFEAAVGPCHDEKELVHKGFQLLEDYNIDALLITRGEQGMTLLQKGKPEHHFSVHRQEVYDVTGAGDTVIAMMASCVAVRHPLPMATTLANIAASIVITKLGATSVTVPELRRVIFHDQLSTARHVVTEKQLQIMIEDAHAHGERIVMTGGCFDIIHAGHIKYLEEAKALGDRLIVAVNDDASVRRLKGSTRPINSLKDRMAVLSGLKTVDWVVPFSEDTPERIVDCLRPDVWVKGGDYTVNDLPEAQSVVKNGGEVKILSLVDGCSTSNIIERIQNKDKIEA